MVDKQIAHEIPVYRGIFYGGIMVTKILLAIMLVLYIKLLLLRGSAFSAVSGDSLPCPD